KNGPALLRFRPRLRSFLKTSVSHHANGRSGSSTCSGGPRCHAAGTLLRWKNPRCSQQIFESGFDRFATRGDGWSPLPDVKDDASGERLQRVVGVVDRGELAGAILHTRGDLLVGEWEVRAELRLIGEGCRAAGAGSVVGADPSDFKLEVRDDGQWSA